MQNSLCLFIDNNCGAHDEVSPSGHVDISAKVSTTANCKFEKIPTLLC